MRFPILMLMVVTMASHSRQTAMASDRGADVVPRPTRFQMATGVFEISQSTPILVDDDAECRAIGQDLADHLRAAAGFQLAVRAIGPATPPKGSIVVTTVGGIEALGPEGYDLIVLPSALMLRAPRPAGLFYGVQTLRQLLPPERAPSAAGEAEVLEIPSQRIQDQPRYPWRGFMLDCARHFMTKDFIKRQIDLIAYHKLNVFHWHLTDDQGLRIEIHKYPKLTEVGAWRGADRYGGFYTQDDIREIVAYAAGRYVTVVPEIEMPGHALAALAAYPELSCTGGPHTVTARWGVHEDVYCAGNEATFELLTGVLDEVVGLFPSKYIHVGGDECPKTRWKECAKCRQRMLDERLPDEQALQSYFIKRVDAYLKTKGRRIIGWDEILEGGLPPDATVQSWRGLEGAIAAARAGHDVIVSPTSHCYLDYAQGRGPDEPLRMGFLPLETVYEFEPTPAALTPDQARHVLGAQGNMWTEHAPQARVDHQVFPRLCALAEVMWSPRESRDWNDFTRRMKTHYRRLDRLGVRYFPAPPRCASPNLVFENSVEVVLENPLDQGAIHYTLDGGEPSPASPRYAGPFKLSASTTVKARTYLDDGRATEIVEFQFRAARDGEPTDSSDAANGN